MEKTIQRPRKDQKSFIRRVAKQIFKRQEVPSRAIYNIDMQDNAIWEMSAHDALRIPLTGSPLQSGHFPKNETPDSDTPKPERHAAESQLLEQTYADVSDLALDDNLMPAFDSDKTEAPKTSKAKQRPRPKAVPSPSRAVSAAGNTRPSAAARAKAAGPSARRSHNSDDGSDSSGIPQLTNQVSPASTSIEKAGARLTHLFEPASRDRQLPSEKASTEDTSGFQAAAKKIKAARGSNEIVLLVEPNNKVRSALANMIKSLGVRCLPVGSAKEALNFLHRFRPSVIILDQNLKDMSTPEVVICMRGLYRTRPVPIVLMSEEDTELFSDWTRRLDINHYLAKPFNIFGLERAIGRYAKIKPAKSNKPYAGSVGLIVERPDLRHYLSRFLVRHNYCIGVSCDPEKLQHAAEFAQQQPLDAWLVQTNDEDLCADVVEELESTFDIPVYIGFDDLDPTSCNDRQKLCWNGRLLDKLGKLLSSREIQQVAEQVA
ncbi:hypothetical protein BTA51_08025 [Hahella sp. CCB-MM4]|uniref:response regulator n=1 Tax=Hahella sp. (strain CCB-MM4) TaxID=1926491 RepID=UPI000B9B6764|nr:response regulator [Hahella sp. CCB-MM4]OZG73751.1 hypothetical protein BTA51_08025 [Hahella sp. CCB-MM4]